MQVYPALKRWAFFMPSPTGLRRCFASYPAPRSAPALSRLLGYDMPRLRRLGLWQSRCAAEGARSPPPRAVLHSLLVPDENDRHIIFIGDAEAGQGAECLSHRQSLLPRRSVCAWVKPA